MVYRRNLEKANSLMLALLGERLIYYTFFPAVGEQVFLMSSFFVTWEKLRDEMPSHLEIQRHQERDTFQLPTCSFPCTTGTYHSSEWK
jgi:hypothetical protein